MYVTDARPGLQAVGQSNGGTDKIIGRSNIDSDGLAMVRVTGKINGALKQLIAGNGGTVLNAYKKDHVLLARIPLTALPTVAASDSVTTITEPELLTTNVGVVTTQG